MRFRVSSATKRLVGKLDDGDELVEVLTRLCDNHDVGAGEVRAVGHFDRVELVHFDRTEQTYVPVVEDEGSFELVGLTGNVSRLGDEVALRLNAVFTVVGPTGPETIGGQLRSARATEGEFVITAFSDLEMERRLDNETGRLLLDDIERCATADGGGVSEPVEDVDDTEESGASEANGASGMSWDEAIAEAEQTEQQRQKRRNTGGGPSTGSSGGQQETESERDPYEDFDFDEPLISVGDFIDHPKLGKCRVLEVDEQYVKVRLPRGRIRKLALEVLDIEYTGEEDGQQVFDAQVKR